MRRRQNTQTATTTAQPLDPKSLALDKVRGGYGYGGYGGYGGGYGGGYSGGGYGGWGGGYGGGYSSYASNSWGGFSSALA